jgi:hypothetical protein
MNVRREPKRGRISTKNDAEEMNRRHGLTCGVAVKGAAICQAAQHGMDRLTETLGVRVVCEVHRVTGFGHYHLYLLTAVRGKIVRKVSNSNRSTHLQSHHPRSADG